MADILCQNCVDHVSVLKIAVNRHQNHRGCFSASNADVCQHTISPPPPPLVELTSSFILTSSPRCRPIRTYPTFELATVVASTWFWFRSIAMFKPFRSAQFLALYHKYNSSYIRFLVTGFPDMIYSSSTPSWRIHAFWPPSPPSSDKHQYLKYGNIPWSHYCYQFPDSDLIKRTALIVWRIPEFVWGWSIPMAISIYIPSVFSNFVHVLKLSR